MIIERELMKTDTTLAVVTNSLSHRCPTSAEVTSLSAVSLNDVGHSTAVTSDAATVSVAGQDQKSVPVDRDVSEALVQDGRDRWQSPMSPAECGLKILHTNHTEELRNERQLNKQQSLCCQPSSAVTVKKSNAGGLDSCPAVHFVPQQTMSSSSQADGYAELPFMSAAATLDGLCKSRLSSVEINNNCRRGYVNSQKVVGNVIDAAVRKSQRSNRGRRYHELMSQRAYQHHASRKRSESLTM